MNRKNIWGWVFALVLGLTAILPASVTNAAEAEGQRDFRLLTYNVYMLSHHLYPRWGQTKRAELIQEADFIQQNDLIILNEAFDNPASKKLMNGLSDRYPHQTPVLGRSKKGWDQTRGHYSTTTPEDGGVAVVSKYPITEKIQHVYKNGCGADWFSNKGFVYVKVKRGNQFFHVIGTHMQSQDKGCFRGKAESVRRSQLQEIRDFIRDKQIPTDEPLFIGGDFNVIKDTDEYRDMLNTLRVDEPRFTGHSSTWDPVTNSIAGYNYPELPPEFLDYLFVSKDHAPIKGWNNHVWKSKSPKWKGGRYEYDDYSDHYPVTGSGSF
ncbi:sphingomyelin phosphodiesterase [Salinithrix halophila]|uniref:Sphingomyelin phosphodiesterase n=1 Tax=Salinithrix halophila TaxID=1485204 RepID=A0ABV8JIA5_9BACL